MEIRSTVDPVTAQPGRIAGYALKFDTLSRNLGGFVESVAPGAIAKTLADNLDVLCRFQHEDEFLLGRTASGTLTLRADTVGLWYECDLPSTDYAENVSALASRGDITGSSFAFICMEDSWSETEQGYPLRVLESIKLIDVAPVVTPAYTDTSAGLRALAEARGLDAQAVLDAAAANTLASVLAPPPPQEQPVGTPRADHARRRLAIARQHH